MSHLFWMKQKLTYELASIFSPTQRMDVTSQLVTIIIQTSQVRNHGGVHIIEAKPTCTLTGKSTGNMCGKQNTYVLGTGVTPIL